MPAMTNPTDKKLILVVDDEPRMTKFVRMNLELEGYRVAEASNGLEALQKVKNDLPDLVILDVNMPELDGFETLSLLRQSGSVPVIMLTVKGDEEDRIPSTAGRKERVPPTSEGCVTTTSVPGGSPTTENG